MKTFLLSLASLCLLACSAGAANPITNGGFEELTPMGLAPGWELLGNAAVRTEHVAAGQRALCLQRKPNADGETGLNRAWELRSGRQGGMLAECKGAIRFRYFAVAQDEPGALTVQIIPMTEKCLEYGGKRTVWRVPSNQVGDGKWHEGEFAYDYSQAEEARWVHVGARLLAPGELWLDEFEWVPEVDAVPQISKLDFLERPGQEGRDGWLLATIVNMGSKPLAAGTASLDLPVGLTGTDAVIVTPVLAPTASTTVRLPVHGVRAAPTYELGFALDAGDKQATAELLLRAETKLQSLACQSLMVKPGKPTRVDLLAENLGHVMVGALPAELVGPADVRIEHLPQDVPLAPGLVAPVASWQVTVPEASPLVRLRAMSPTGEAVETQLVAADPGHPPRRLGRDVGVNVAENWLVVGSRQVRLALFPVAAGSRGGLFQVRRGWWWQTVAVLPRLGLLRTPVGESSLVFDSVTFRTQDHDTMLRLAGVTTVGGATWNAVCELRVAAEADTIGYRLEVTPLDDGHFLALEGPMLYAGEDLPEREDAILPGLEWLVRGEESSNGLDIKPDHPDFLRYVPHPLKVTVPAVGMRFGDVTVGLHWPAPPEQESAPLAGSQSLVFASPDRFGGHPSHLVGLMLPGVDRGLPENARVATEPLDSTGQTLVITGTLVASIGATDSLVVLDRWYAAHGFPTPLPFPRGGAVEEIAFSLGAYAKDKALWNPEWNKWYSDIIVGFRPTLDPVYELLLGAKLLGDKPEAAWAQGLATEVAGQPLPAAERVLHHDISAESIKGLVREAQVLVTQQQPDGNWVFGGEKAADDWPESGVDYSKLGPKGARAVGFTAGPATKVLDAALLSGDEGLRAAGLKALAAMREFRVPRAAQVWEVPAHTPDILASARAVDACLAGHRLTGDQQYLADAVYWARTGLPFVYVWHPADQPLVQGTSIPVFGATSYVLSWFAVAVQWNGLCYSQSLYDLAAYDQSFPWARVADNILVSGMYQQATEGDRLGQWPDAVNLIVPRRGPHGQTPPCFRPSTIINQTLLGLGIRRHAGNLPLRRGRQQIALRTTAEITQSDWHGRQIAITARFVSPVSGTIALLGIDEPTRVLVNGQAVASGEPGAQASWQWSAKEAMLSVDLPTSGEYEIVIAGVHARAGQWLPEAVHEIAFDFGQGVQGWEPAHDLAPLAATGGVLTTAATGSDPYMTRGGLLVGGTPGDVLEVELAVTGGGATMPVQVFWGTSQAPGFAPERSLQAESVADGAFHTITIPVGEHAQWQGQTIVALRLDPGAGGKPIQLRRIQRVAGK